MTDSWKDKAIDAALKVEELSNPEIYVVRTKASSPILVTINKGHASETMGRIMGMDPTVFCEIWQGGEMISDGSRV